MTGAKVECMCACREKRVVPVGKQVKRFYPQKFSGKLVVPVTRLYRNYRSFLCHVYFVYFVHILSTKDMLVYTATLLFILAIPAISKNITRYNSLPLPSLFPFARKILNRTSFLVSPPRPHPHKKRRLLP